MINKIQATSFYVCLDDYLDELYEKNNWSTSPMPTESTQRYRPDYLLNNLEVTLKPLHELKRYVGYP